MSEKCPICEKLVDVCKEVGEDQFCTILLNKLYNKKITPDQFVDELLKNQKVAEKLEVRG